MMLARPSTRGVPAQPSTLRPSGLSFAAYPQRFTWAASVALCFAFLGLASWPVRRTAWLQAFLLLLLLAVNEQNLCFLTID